MTTTAVTPLTRPRPIPSLVGCALAVASLAVACDSEPRPANTAVEAGLQQVANRAVAKPDVILPPREATRS